MGSVRHTGDVYFHLMEMLKDNVLVIVPQFLHSGQVSFMVCNNTLKTR